jgi:hypothetical protein
VRLRGISYTVDHDTDVRRDLEVIRDELHCTTVLLYGAHIGRLRVAARTARELGRERKAAFGEPARLYAPNRVEG